MELDQPFTIHHLASNNSNNSDNSDNSDNSHSHSNRDAARIIAQLDGSSAEQCSRPPPPPTAAMSSNFNARFPPKPVNKKSIFERQRAEAEAKRQREAAETAAVYEDFVKSFDDGGAGAAAPGRGIPHTTGFHGGAQQQQQQQSPSSMPQPKGGATVGSTGGRRHFSMPSAGPSGLRNSGPGSLGPAPPGSAGGGSSSSYTDRRYRDEPSRTGSRLAFGDDDDSSDEEGQIGDGENSSRRRTGGGAGVGGGGGGASSSSAVDRAEEKATSKPTVRLANLPPGTSPAAVRALVAGGSTLAVDGVRMLPAAPAGPTDRKSVAAIVTLAADTAASDIDVAVSALQNRYLGYGYYLTLHRHLSSAVVASSATLAAAGSAALSSSAGGSGVQPFGARPVPPPSKSDGPPGAGFSSPSGSGFAPPSSFHHGGGGRHFGHHGRGGGGGGGASSRDGILYVPVRAPRDIKKLRMIHKVVEGVLDQGPELEALLMSRPEVQRDERWAWIWDARSEAGVWYRYRLWEAVTGGGGQAGPGQQGKYVPLFEGGHAWKVPDRPLPYEFGTSLAELVGDAAYDSSDDSEMDEDNNKNNKEAAGSDEDAFLNPLDKARLAHLLARLPTTLSKLRRGDIARVTAFAIAHASRGADEIVDMIVANVERPFAYTAANPAYQKSPAVDTSGAQLVAVYAVSDILSSSATSSVRHAWRFRQLFEAALRGRGVFASLGRLAERLRWGRLRADKWKRSVGLVLGQWEGWSVFSAETQAFFVATFENPPSLGNKKDEKDEAAAAAGAAAKKGRWKTVDNNAAATPPAEESAPSGFRPVELDSAAAAGAEPDADAEGAQSAGDRDRDSGGDADDEWAYRSEYTDDEALDLACMDDEDIDGEPMDDDSGGADNANINGIPLTAEEVRALVGDITEMSEEGEIGSDDDAYEMSGLSAMSSGGGSGDDQDDREDADGASDVEMEDAGPPAAGGVEARAEPDRAEHNVREDRAVQKDQTKLVGRFQIAGGTTASGAAAATASRKRMRAADMFADDPETEGGDEE